VDGEVCELIRRRGIDPVVDAAATRLLVRDVVADYSERSLTSALPPIGDLESVGSATSSAGWRGSGRCSGGWTAQRWWRSGSKAV
jgi:hypothetical protein